jgi:hypothetical protein
MRFAAGLTATGIVGWLLLETLKILVVPVTAWIMGLLAVALKIALMVLAVGAALGVGVFFFRRARKAQAEAETEA